MRYYAELVNSLGCSLGYVDANSMEELRKEIASEFLPVLDAGDRIVVTYE